MKKMTLNAIKAMFADGETWVATNTMHDTANGPRTLVKLNTVDFRWARPGKPDFYTQIPKARDIIEAEDGYVKFYIDRDHKHTLTLKKEDT